MGLNLTRNHFDFDGDQAQTNGVPQGGQRCC